MILLIGFQTARRALNGDVAPIYSTPAAGDCQNAVIFTVFSIIFSLVIGKFCLHQRFPQVSYDRFIYFLDDFVNGHHTQAKQLRNGESVVTSI